MRRRRYREEVLQDLAEAASWYEERRPGLAARFLEAVDHTMARIEENPESFRVIHENLRRALVPRPFPYQVFFQVHAEYVDVYAILHAARDPEAWKRRL